MRIYKRKASTVEANSKDEAWEMFEATQEFDDNTTCEKSETINDSAEVEEVKKNEKK